MIIIKLVRKQMSAPAWKQALLVGKEKQLEIYGTPLITSSKINKRSRDNLLTMFPNPRPR